MSWEFQDHLPIYAQLMDTLKRRIVTGRYLPGEKLPSVRELAAEAGINPNTVQRAFSELEREGLIYTRAQPENTSPKTRRTSNPPAKPLPERRSRIFCAPCSLSASAWAM